MLNPLLALERSVNEIRINEVSWFLNVHEINGKSYEYYGDSKYILEINSLHTLLTIINDVLAYDELAVFLSLAVVLECHSLAQNLAILCFGMLKSSLPRLMISKDLTLVLRSSVQVSGRAIYWYATYFHIILERYKLIGNATYISK